MGIGQQLDYWQRERAGVLETFNKMLAQVTGDGSVKRRSGLKPPWWSDVSHEAAIFSHLNKWKHGELLDSDSGAHPLVHLAWRALAIAYQETYGKVDPVRDHDAADNYKDSLPKVGDQTPLVGSGDLAEFQERVEGLEARENQAPAGWISVDNTSPRVRSLREHGLRG